MTPDSGDVDSRGWPRHSDGRVQSKKEADDLPSVVEKAGSDKAA